MKKLCIYHGNCADGFGSAVIVREALGSNNVEFHAGVHNNTPPNVTKREVIIVDFSYKRQVLLEMAEKAKTILIIDHHKSAEADLVDLPDNVTAHFDMNRSGAMMTWDHYFSHTPPQLIKHIQDRDLWRFEIEGTREIQAALFSYPYDFDLWHGLIFSTDPESENNLRKEGQAIERKHFKDIHEFIDVGAYRMTIAGYDVPVLNMPYFFVSDAAHALAKGEPFAACYWDTKEGRVFGLRSVEGGIDVSEVAVKFNGGGHAQAAGFRIPLPIMKIDDFLTKPC